jgi:hypothetical protein
MVFRGSGRTKSEKKWPQALTTGGNDESEHQRLKKLAKRETRPVEWESKSLLLLGTKTKRKRHLKVGNIKKRESLVAAAAPTRVRTSCGDNSNSGKSIRQLGRQQDEDFLAAGAGAMSENWVGTLAHREWDKCPLDDLTQQNQRTREKSLGRKNNNCWRRRMKPETTDLSPTTKSGWRRRAKQIEM